MTKQPLPESQTPLSPFAYVEESVTAWREFNIRTSELWMEQITGALSGLPAEPTDTSDAETLTSEIMRSVSDLNLRHWQNTARLIDNLPAWMRRPPLSSGAALTDFFDRFQRGVADVTIAEAADTASPAKATASKFERPVMMKKPKGKADDLTKLKGVGPKLSEKLNAVGVYHFRQIASWNDQQAEWVDDLVAGKGRIKRDAWVAQARTFTANGSALH